MFHIVIDSAIDHLQDYPSFTVIPLYLIALRLPVYYESAQS